jgi:hypothetical protein
MTIIIEINKPFQKKPGYYKSNLMKMRKQFNGDKNGKWRAKNTKAS